jgi:PKHD-type hydroxylase
MIHPFASPPNNPDANEHMTYHETGLTGEEINLIRSIGDVLDVKPLALFGKHDESHVKASGARFPLNDETRWVYDRMAKAAMAINAAIYRYDLTGFEENFHYLTYRAGQHFNWHLDMGQHTPAPRKLSLILQLSDPEEYEGGDFDVMVATRHIRTLKRRGSIIAFPAYKIHRVTPVTSGVRRTLSMFVVGPNFR